MSDVDVNNRKFYAGLVPANSRATKTSFLGSVFLLVEGIKFYSKIPPA